MEILQRLGIPFEALASERLRNQASALSGKSSIPGTVIDPSDADDYFGKLLAPAVMGSEPLTSLVDGDDSLLARFESMCRAYAKRSPKPEYWQAEADVWSLLREVLPPLSASVSMNTSCSPRALVQAHIEGSPLMQHILRVKSWLEATAGPFVPAEHRQAPVPLTLDALVPLDPDCKASRDALDMAWEEAHLTTLWCHLRRGQLQEAIAACFAVGQPWRAAILSGGFLSSDPPAPGQSVSGNPARPLWVSTVAGLIRTPELSSVERALYAALIGDFTAMQPLCLSWQDVLWAALVSLLEKAVQQIVSGSPPDESNLSALLASSLASVEQRFPALAQDDALFSAVRVLVLQQDWSQALFPHLAKGGDAFTRLTAVGAILLNGRWPAPMQPAYYDVIIHGYLMRLLETEQTRHWLFYASRLCGEELRNDALAAFWSRLASRPKELQWLRLREARFHGLSLASSLSLCLAQEDKNREVQSLLDLLSFPEDPELLPLLAEYAAMLLRRALLRSDWSAARSLLSSLPIPALATIIDAGDQQPCIPFVKEIFYYGHLVQVISAYETWSSAYATALSGSELDAYYSAGTAFAEEALRLLTADWLGDVEAVPEARFGTAVEREDQLLRLRAIHLSDLALLLLALLATEPPPRLSSSLIASIVTALAEPSLELWVDWHRAGRLAAVVERLQRLRLVGEAERGRQATLVFLQDAMRSL